MCFLRTGRAAALLLFFAALAVPSRIAVAGECAGMTHYEYDGGECTDKAGDTTDILIGSGRDSYRMGLDQINRSRPGFSGGGGDSGTAFRGPTRGQYQAAGRLLLFHHVPHMFAPLHAAATATLRDKSERRALLQFYRNVLSDWNANASKYGFYIGSVPDARLYFVESAFHAYDGKWATNSRTPFAVYSLLLRSMVHNQALLQLDNENKQELAERYVVYAGILRALSTYVSRRHGANSDAERAHLRQFAAAALKDDLGIAAPNYGIDYLPCALYTQPFASCESVLRFLRSE